MLRIARLAAARIGMTGHTTREVSQLIGLTPAQIRRCVRLGLVSPRRGRHNEYRFDFPDLVLLRTVKSLRQASVPSRRALAALRHLQTLLGRSRALASVRVVAEAGDVVIEEADARWNAMTGQGHLAMAEGDANPGSAAGARPPIVARMPERLVDRDTPDRHDWFELGVSLEAQDPVRAAVAFLVALELDPHFTDAHVHLARLKHREGRREDARLHFSRALADEPANQHALLGLGTLFQEEGDLEAAERCYAQAADLAEAHLRLHRLCEQRGDRISGRRHLQRYRQLLAAGETDDRGA